MVLLGTNLLEVYIGSIYLLSVPLILENFSWFCNDLILSFAININLSVIPFTNSHLNLL